MTRAILKVSVLADGTLLLDGNAITISELAQALDARPREDSAVWYYRENAAGEAPPIAMEVMKLIVDRKLPVRLSSKPDFSDTVTPQMAIGVEQVFTAIRQRAAQRQLVILRSDGRQFAVAAMAREAAPADAVAAVEGLLPSSVKRSVAVIADTSWAMTAKPNMRDAAGAIPFLGLLLGFAAIGHAVWIFDAGAPATLAAGCREADLVIVDSARLEALPSGWEHTVAPVMRKPQILVYDRDTQQLRKP